MTILLAIGMRIIINPNTTVTENCNSFNEMWEEVQTNCDPICSVHQPSTTLEATVIYVGKGGD